MKKIAIGLGSFIIAMAVPGGLIMLICYYFTRNRKKVSY